MRPWLLFVLLLGKHFIVANVLDVGYSEARYRASRHPWRALAQHLALEGVVSALIFGYLPWLPLTLAVAIEGYFQWVNCLIERHASLPSILRVHVFCETGLIACYAILVALFTP